MRFELLDNGVDSLKFGLDFYSQFLNLENKYDETNPGFLKMSVICIQNAIELFIKKILSNFNELLIYKDISNEKLLEIYAFKLNNNFKTPLDYQLINDIDIITIDYSKLIDRFSIMCGLKPTETKTLYNLGRLRNKLTHFGLDKMIDFYEVLVVLNNSIDIIAEVIYEKLNPNKDKRHVLDPIYDIMLDLLEVGRVEEEEAWSTFFSDNFVEINNLFGNLIIDKEFIYSIAQSGYKMEIELGKYGDSQDITCNFIHSDEEKCEFINSYNYPVANATLFAGESDQGPIYFILDHSVDKTDDNKYKNFYIYKKPYYKDSINNISEKFWLMDEKNRICYGTQFNYEQLKRGICIILGI